MNMNMKFETGDFYSFILLGALLTHIVGCIMAKAWLFLCFGTLIFPFGMIHGVMFWFGFRL